MSEKTVQEWLEDLGIDPSAAERYAAGLAQPKIGYNKVAELDTIDKDILTEAGVDVARHRAIIMRAVQGLMAAGSGNTQGISGSPKGAEGTPLALPSDFFSQQRMGLRLEGLKTTPWVLKREQLCDRLCKIVDTEQILLVRGPFASGKTALAQLLHHFLSQAKKNVHVVTLAGATVSWEKWFYKETGLEWTDIERTGPVYVIIDEVQLSYSTESSTHDLWSSIKGLGTKGAPVYFICLGSYGNPQQGPTTPTTFSAIVSLHPDNGTPGLAYTPEEFNMLRKLFLEHGGFEIDERSANYIFHLTGGHPGIVGWILKSMYEHAKNFGSDVEATKKDLYMYLHSADLHNSLRNAACRAIPNFSDYPLIINVCKHVLGGTFDAHSFAGDEQYKLCLKASILVEVGDSVEFTSPVVRDRALAYYFSEAREAPVSLDAFIVAVVQRFSPSQLRETKSTDTKSRPLEAQWQQEFYRAAASLLPPDAFISPEYGRGQGVPGQVDFYIAKYKWMIEVVREGLDMARHEQRFEPGGQYAPLINGGDWCVVDFRGAGKEVRRQPHDHTYHVIFNQNKKIFKIYDPSGRSAY